MPNFTGITAKDKIDYSKIYPKENYEFTQMHTTFGQIGMKGLWVSFKTERQARPEINLSKAQKFLNQ